jgi:hypothetical protein
MQKVKLLLLTVVIVMMVVLAACDIDSFFSANPSVPLPETSPPTQNDTSEPATPPTQNDTPEPAAEPTPYSDTDTTTIQSMLGFEGRFREMRENSTIGSAFEIAIGYAATTHLLN